MALTPAQKGEAATIYAMLGTCQKQLAKLWLASQDSYIGEAATETQVALRHIEITVKTPTPKPSQE